MKQREESLKEGGENERKTKDRRQTRWHDRRGSHKNEEAAGRWKRTEGTGGKEELQT
jgi:hypothetical protein